MSSDFGSARRWAERFILDALHEGSTAIDATLGNGHDAERLCALVGETGHVFGFDVQKEAVERTRQRLADRGLLSRARPRSSRSAPFRLTFATNVRNAKPA